MPQPTTTEHSEGNYPPPGDTTSEGGYGGGGTGEEGQAFAPVSQRGLIDETASGQPLGNELEDAWQGTDETSTRHYNEDSNRQPGKSLNPYRESMETREEAGAQLAAGATDTRARTYQDEIPNKNN